MLDMQWVRTQMDNASSGRLTLVDDAVTEGMKTVNLSTRAWFATAIVLGALLALRIFRSLPKNRPVNRSTRIMKEMYATEFFD